ncbi:type VI secretion system baseplate subunit TssF [Rheinheimera maricola]|uniref:Type VI secretion system baseplate subunit TssF n=1 Tax=Rheinheimera maricola TaxID=2793282 RepID=A0ABS7XE47_9GAMM|nr:type VI secretion system baseplate subunit TssF [Rheinheimera maricola]MBZ9613415.1 type VI secretion system baseplate subunit TssF [Rheinheimera maricola]
MAQNKFFQDELNYLRELGAAFAEQNPSLANLLSEEGEDPDVERLFEGFAFLTGRIRQKLEDEIPEISHSLIELLWPNYLRPVPAMSILAFTPRLHVLSEQTKIAKGAVVQSAEVDGTACIFRTCYDVDVSPIAISDAKITHKTDSTELSLHFSLESGVASADLGLKKIRLFLHDEQKIQVATVLYLHFFRYLQNFDVALNFYDGTVKLVQGLSKEYVHPVGFADSESLLPADSSMFSGYRLLQEYFQFQKKFLFIDIKGIGNLISLPDIESFSLKFRFSKFDIDSIKKENFRLFCTPIVNLFEHDGSPIRVNNQRIEYFLRPDTKFSSHIEIFSVDSVEGKVKGKIDQNTYTAYETFQHHDLQLSTSNSFFYKLRKVPATISDGVDHYLYLHNSSANEFADHEEIISTRLTCTNRNLASALQVGQVAYYSGNSPDIVTFKNIINTTEALPPPFERKLHWRLISNLAIQYNSLASIDSLRLLIKYYDFAAIGNRQKQRSNQQMHEGIEFINTSTYERIVKGLPVSGLKTTLHLRESKFGAKGLIGEANMFIFASVLNIFFSQYARTNSFHILEVIAVESGENYQWNMHHGKRALF